MEVYTFLLDTYLSIHKQHRADHHKVRILVLLYLAVKRHDGLLPVLVVLVAQVDDELLARVGGDAIDTVADGDGDQEVDDGGTGHRDALERHGDDEHGGDELVGAVLGQDVVVVLHHGLRRQFSMLALGIWEDRRGAGGKRYSNT